MQSLYLIDSSSILRFNRLFRFRSVILKELSTIKGFLSDYKAQQAQPEAELSTDGHVVIIKIVSGDKIDHGGRAGEASPKISSDGGYIT